MLFNNSTKMFSNNSDKSYIEIKKKLTTNIIKDIESFRKSLSYEKSDKFISILWGPIIYAIIVSGNMTEKSSFFRDFKIFPFILKNLGLIGYVAMIPIVIGRFSRTLKYITGSENQEERFDCIQKNIRDSLIIYEEEKTLKKDIETAFIIINKPSNFVELTIYVTSQLFIYIGLLYMSVNNPSSKDYKAYSMIIFTGVVSNAYISIKKNIAYTTVFNRLFAIISGNK